MTLAIINYGMGNLGSVVRTFDSLGVDTAIVDRPEQLNAADRIVLPGVGSFKEAMLRLNALNWCSAIKQQVCEFNKPILGICLGMQLLVSHGIEGGETDGLNLIPGKVVHLNEVGCLERVPHIGWNNIQLTQLSSLFHGVTNEADFYFVHSYTALPNLEEHIIATVDYSKPLVAAIAKGHIFGVQFHPEKSSKAGRQLLLNFLEFEPC